LTRQLLFCFVVFSTILSCKKVNETGIIVTSIYPDSDGPGASVQIYGKGFGNNAAKDALYFNGAKATIDLLPGHLTYRSPTNFVILTGTWIQKASFPGCQGPMPLHFR
jgi:hypothetical protein